jgi:hypothetical protein
VGLDGNIKSLEGQLFDRCLEVVGGQPSGDSAIGFGVEKDLARSRRALQPGGQVSRLAQHAEVGARSKRPDHSRSGRDPDSDRQLERAGLVP